MIDFLQSTKHMTRTSAVYNLQKGIVRSAMTKRIQRSQSFLFRVDLRCPFMNISVYRGSHRDKYCNGHSKNYFSLGLN